MPDPRQFDDSKNAASVREIAHAMEADEQDKRTKEMFVQAFQEVLHSNTDEAPVLVKRIPFICNDIRTMKTDIADIKGNIKWGVRTVIGAVLLGFIALLIKTHLP